MRLQHLLIFCGSFCFQALIGFSQELSDKPLKPDCYETRLINQDKVADAYPFISGDGLRLYFTSNRLGGHGRFFISERKSVKEAFAAPKLLSEFLVDGYYAGSFTEDELTLCMVKSGSIYISKRQNLQTSFGTPVKVKGITESYLFGPAISPDGEQIIVMSKTDGVDAVKQFRRTADYSYTADGELAIPEKGKPGPGQFSKDGLHYFFSLENSQTGVTIWRYTRRSIFERFVDLEELPVKINALQRNFQPSVNADGTILVHTTSQNDLWEEDDLVLVNDPQMKLVAPEQFASVLKNKSESITVINKVLTTEVKTFPNPFTDNVVVEMSEAPASGTIFILYDLGGRVIQRFPINNKRTSITISNIAPATYVYQVIDAKKKLIASGKLIKL